MGQIARFTTPAVSYKPRAVPIETIEQVYLVMKQGGRIVIEKDKDAASVIDGGFVWTMTQEDTSRLDPHRHVAIQVDYLTDNGMRYTTVPREYVVTNSGLNEVI